MSQYAAKEEPDQPPDEKDEPVEEEDITILLQEMEEYFHLPAQAYRPALPRGS